MEKEVALNEDDGFHSRVVRDIIESRGDENKWTLTTLKGANRCGFLE